MSLRVIWQYMDRSVTKKILYGRHMAVYGPVRHQKNIIWTSEASVNIIFFFVTDRSIYCHMTILGDHCLYTCKAEVGYNVKLYTSARLM